MGSGEVLLWTEEGGETKWYLHEVASGKIFEEPTEIVAHIRWTPETPRHYTMEQKTLGEIRTTVERHIKNTYLKAAQAPVGVKPVLKAWMELS